MSSYGDGSSDALGHIYLTGIVSAALLVVFGIGYWLHTRHENRENADCEARGGVRIVGRDAMYCVRKDAIAPPASVAASARVVLPLDECRAWADKARPFAGLTDQECAEAWEAAHAKPEGDA